MTPNQAHQLADFADLIKRRITLIRMNDHHPILLDTEDHRDFELEDAYEAIRPLLICISEPKLYEGVASLPENQGPFVAENAHHALSIQFNPPESMFGNPSLLESNAIKHMLDHASVERSRLAEMPTIPVAEPILPRCGVEVWDPDYVPRWIIPSPSLSSNGQYPAVESASTKMLQGKRSTTRKNKAPSPSRKSRFTCSGRTKVTPDEVFSGDALKLLSLLMEFHIKHDGSEVHTKIGRQADIANMLGGREKQWDQKRVSEAFQELMADVKGFANLKCGTRYGKLCNTPRITEVLKQLDLKSVAPRLKHHGVAEYIEEFSRNGREDFR